MKKFNFKLNFKTFNYNQLVMLNYFDMFTQENFK